MHIQSNISVARNLLLYIIKTGMIKLLQVQCLSITKAINQIRAKNNLNYKKKVHNQVVEKF